MAPPMLADPDEGAIPPGRGGPPTGRSFWRRPAMVLALALDLAIAIATAWALANGFQPIVVAFAAILGMAPWAAIIDEAERPRRR